MKTCSRCGQEVRRIYSIASDGPDDYIPSCGCIDWDGWIVLGFLAVVGTVAVLIGRAL